MASIIFFEERLRVPLGLSSLQDFRVWSRSEDFPESGRIDFVDGDIEVDLSPEDLFTHGTVKTTLAAAILRRAEQRDLGHLLCDSARVSNTEANLSVEPDVLLITHDAIETGRVTFVPTAGNLPDRYIEIEGTPELIVGDRERQFGRQGYETTPRGLPRGRRPGVLARGCASPAVVLPDLHPLRRRIPASHN